MRSIKKPAFLKFFLIRSAALVLAFLSIAFAILAYLVKTQREKNFNKLCFELNQMSALMQLIYEQGTISSPESLTYISQIQSKLDSIWAEDNIYISAYFYNSKIAETRNRAIAIYPISYFGSEYFFYLYKNELELEDMTVLPKELLNPEVYPSTNSQEGKDPVKSILDSFSKKKTRKSYVLREIYTNEENKVLPGMLMYADMPEEGENENSLVVYMNDYDNNAIEVFTSLDDDLSIITNYSSYEELCDLTPEDTTGYEYIEGLCYVMAFYCPPEKALTESDVNYMYGYNGSEQLYKLDKSIEYSKDDINGNSTVSYNSTVYQDITSVRIFPNFEWSLRVAYNEKPSAFEMMPYTCVTLPVLALIIALVIAFIWSYLKYTHDRSVWEVLEFRRKTTEAMAHDLKTPLAAITACVETLQEGFELDPAPHYEVLSQNTATMNRMVEDILGFTRSESGSLTVEPEIVDLDSLIEQSIKDHSTLLKAASLKTVFEDSSVKIETDPKLFKQALDNLFANCARHADPNSTVTVKLTTAELTISNKTSLKVDDVNELKKPFVKGETSRSQSGTGLGLSIVENNLRLLGYSLDLSLKDGIFTAKIKF
ncbi:MAG: HAMP domain-containing histidine kinase [Clostridia bacterium]|nr:HAMP domain-containing histidine kinase [Clostridia bacterium]